MAPPKGKAAKRLTPAEVEQIVALKLDMVPVVEIAKLVGVAKNTVTERWRQWLNETQDDRRANLELHRSEQIARLDSGAGLCRQLAVEARADPDLEPDERARIVARYLTEERQARRALCTVAGFDAPVRVQAVVFDTMSESEAQAILDQR